MTSVTIEAGIGNSLFKKQDKTALKTPLSYVINIKFWNFREGNDIFMVVFRYF